MIRRRVTLDRLEELAHAAHAAIEIDRARGLALATIHGREYSAPLEDETATS